MASRSHREMAAAIGFADVFSKQLKAWYQAEKPRAKRIIPILDRIIEAAETQLLYFRKELTINDVVKHIGNKVDRFNATTRNCMDKKESAAFIIGMIAERICELTEKGAKPDHIERLESVLKPMEELYEYLDEVIKDDIEEESSGLFKAWEAA